MKDRVMKSQIPFKYTGGGASKQQALLTTKHDFAENIDLLTTGPLNNNLDFFRDFLFFCVSF